MNKIEKQKGALIGLGIASIVLSFILLVVGVFMLVKGVPALADATKTKGILLIVFGAIATLLFFPMVCFGVYQTWIGFSLKATTGSIKEGNIAKEGGTVNIKKCPRCGTELKDGETVCSECEKPVE